MVCLSLSRLTRRRLWRKASGLARSKRPAGAAVMKELRARRPGPRTDCGIGVNHGNDHVCINSWLKKPTKEDEAS
jgi:hypothetical protein